MRADPTTREKTHLAYAVDDLSSPEDGEMAPDGKASRRSRSRSRTGRSIQQEPGQKIHLSSWRGRKEKERMISEMSMSKFPADRPDKKQRWIKKNEAYIEYVDSLYVKVNGLIKKRDWKAAGKILKEYNAIPTLKNNPNRFNLCRKINGEDIYVFAEMDDMIKNAKILAHYNLEDGFQLELIESQLHDERYNQEFVSRFCFFVRNQLFNDKYHENTYKVICERGNIVLRSMSLIISFGLGGRFCNEIISYMFRAIKMLSICDGYETEKKQLHNFDKIYDRTYKNCFCFSEEDILFLLGKVQGGRLGLLCMWKLLKRLFEDLPHEFTIIPRYIEAVRRLTTGCYEDEFNKVGRSHHQIKALGIKVSDYAECHQVIINSLLNLAGRHGSGDFNILCRTLLRTCLILVDSDYLKVLHDMSEHRFAEAIERLKLLFENTSSASASRFSDTLPERVSVLELTLAYCHIKNGNGKLCQDILDKMKVKKGSLVHFQQLSLYLMLGLNDFVKQNLPHSSHIDHEIRYAFRKLGVQVDTLLPGDRLENQSRHYLAENIEYLRNALTESGSLKEQVTELTCELATQKSKYVKLRDSKKITSQSSQGDESSDTQQKMQVELVEERSQSEVFANTIVGSNNKTETFLSDNKAKAARIDVLEKEVSRLAEQERKAIKLERTVLEFYEEIESYKAQIARMEDEIATMKKSMELFDKPLPSFSSPRKEAPVIPPALQSLPLDYETFSMNMEDLMDDEGFLR